jgi:hypothetical protein
MSDPNFVLDFGEKKREAQAKDLIKLANELRFKQYEFKKNQELLFQFFDQHWGEIKTDDELGTLRYTLMMYYQTRREKFLKEKKQNGML